MGKKNCTLSRDHRHLSSLGRTKTRQATDVTACSEWNARHRTDPRDARLYGSRGLWRAPREQRVGKTGKMEELCAADASRRSCVAASTAELIRRTAPPDRQTVSPPNLAEATLS